MVNMDMVKEEDESEEEFSRLLMLAGEHLGDSRQLPDDVWRDMQQRSALGRRSRKSNTLMSGPVVYGWWPECIDGARRVVEKVGNYVKDILGHENNH